MRNSDEGVNIGMLWEGKDIGVDIGRYPSGGVDIFQSRIQDCEKSYKTVFNFVFIFFLTEHNEINNMNTAHQITMLSMRVGTEQTPLLGGAKEHPA